LLALINSSREVLYLASVQQDFPQDSFLSSPDQKEQPYYGDNGDDNIKYHSYTSVFVSLYGHSFEAQSGDSLLSLMTFLTPADVGILEI